MSRSDRRLPGDFVCAPLNDPLLCPPEEKAPKEAQNALQQLDYIQYLVEDLGVSVIRETYLLELQKLAVEGIFPCGGRYRTTTRDASLEHGGATHVIPEPSEIRGHVAHLLDRMNVATFGPVERAAYALWRVNWIHPFAGGNGRTARALAYLVLCIDYGRMILGEPSFPTIIATRCDEYQTALRVADVADMDGREDLSAMMTLVGSAIEQQMESAVRRAT